MIFEEILPALKAGKKVRRTGWRNKNAYFTRNASIAITSEDIDADDWEILKEKVKKTAWVVACYDKGAGYVYLRDGASYVLKETAEEIGRRTPSFHSAQPLTVEVEE
jgi:hypothetical protein